jgi:hypothetical protein
MLSFPSTSTGFELTVEKINRLMSRSPAVNQDVALLLNEINNRTGSNGSCAASCARLRDPNRFQFLAESHEFLVGHQIAQA